MKFFTSKLRSQADFYTQIALMLVVVILLEIIGAVMPLRIDITEARIFSVSDVTKETLKSLDDVVTIKAYFSEDVPAQMVTVRQQIKDILGEYKNFGGSNIQIQFLNPTTDSKVEREAQMQGIPPIQFNILKKGKAEVMQGYMGIAVLYEDKVETIPVILRQHLSTLEFDLTAAIKKVTLDKAITIGIVQKQGGVIPLDNLQLLQQLLERNYTVLPVDISSGEVIEEDITTLIIPGPTGEFSERERYVIDQFIMSGRGILVFVDGVVIDQNLLASKNESNIVELLKQYGVTVNQDLVYDPVSNSIATFSQGGRGQIVQFSTEYPYWPQIPKEGFSQNSVLVNQLESLVLPWVSTLDTKGSGYEVLVRTSENAQKRDSNADLSPETSLFPSTKEGGDGQSLPVAVTVTASLKSFFDEPAVAKEGEDKKDEKMLKEVKAARMIVVSDANILEDGFLDRYAGTNSVFIQNLIDGFTLDESLALIRSKVITDRPIKTLDSTARSMVTYGNIFGVPVLVIVFALIRFAWRRKGQRVDNF